MSVLWPAPSSMAQNPKFSTFYTIESCPPNTVPGVSGCVNAGGCERLPTVFNVPLVAYSNNGSASVVGLNSALRLASTRFPHHQPQHAQWKTHN
jgi:hypothetical protein